MGDIFEKEKEFTGHNGRKEFVVSSDVIQLICRRVRCTSGSGLHYLNPNLCKKPSLANQAAT
jgi:hypothetical protein